MVNSLATSAMDKGGQKLFQIYQLLISRISILKEEVEALLSDQNAIRKMKKLDFDLVIVDGLLFNKHVYVIAHILDKPIITFSSSFSLFEAGVPALPSIFPLVQSGLTARMSFLDRLKNLAMLVSIEVVLPLVIPMCNNRYVSKYAPERPYKSISAIASESKLWLSLTDNVIDYPKVTVPSIVNIGGLNTKPAEQLTGDIGVLADLAKEGLIIVSFGSQFTVPLRVLKVFAEAFRGLPQTIIMRHAGEKLPDLPPNFHLKSWMPQNDLLGHPNTLLFITHGGCNGQFEALYHGVPMIGLPILGDQFYNVARAAYHRISLELNLNALTAEDLRKGINTILEDPSYKERILRLSAMLKDRPLTPMQTAIHYIEHVIKYGGDDLRPESVDLPFYQFWCLDLLAFIIVCFVVFSYIICKFCGCLCRSCCRRKVIIKPKPKPKPKSQ